MFEKCIILIVFFQAKVYLLKQIYHPTQYLGCILVTTFQKKKWSRGQSNVQNKIVLCSNIIEFCEFIVIVLFINHIKTTIFIFFLFSIDGTVSLDKFIPFANDQVNQLANCKAIGIQCHKVGTKLPFIVTKRDVFAGEELTYSYGSYEFEWRKVNKSSKPLL